MVLAEIITLRAIALKPLASSSVDTKAVAGRDHNATSYSTETVDTSNQRERSQNAEIITLRAIALKHIRASFNNSPSEQRS